jgi:hypothetical protein
MVSGFKPAGGAAVVVASGRFVELVSKIGSASRQALTLEVV